MTSDAVLSPMFYAISLKAAQSKQIKLSEPAWISAVSTGMYACADLGIWNEFLVVGNKPVSSN